MSRWDSKAYIIVNADTQEEAVELMAEIHGTQVTLEINGEPVVVEIQMDDGPVYEVDE